MKYDLAIDLYRTEVRGCVRYPLYGFNLDKCREYEYKGEVR